MIPSYRGSLEVAVMMGQDSHEFRDLQRSVEKAHGDRERAIHSVCRLYRVRDLRPRIL
ncbi:MAG: hypothetical protein WBE69_22160 [Candidatus Binataceae bacterium]